MPLLPLTGHESFSKRALLLVSHPSFKKFYAVQERTETVTSRLMITCRQESHAIATQSPSTERFPPFLRPPLLGLNTKRSQRDPRRGGPQPAKVNFRQEESFRELSPRVVHCAVPASSSARVHPSLSMAQGLRGRQPSRQQKERPMLGGCRRLDLRP